MIALKSLIYCQNKLHSWTHLHAVDNSRKLCCSDIRFCVKPSSAIMVAGTRRRCRVDVYGLYIFTCSIDRISLLND